MLEWLTPALRPDTVGWKAALVSLVLAAGLSQLIAALYVWTFRGLSYARTFVQSLVMLSVVCCALMMAIGNNLAAGIGVAGGLSIVRFRTSLRDPRDVTFVFASLGAGLAMGLHAYAPGIVGVAVFVAVVLIMHFSAFGERREFDGLVRFSAAPRKEVEEAIALILKTHTRHFVLTTLRSVAQGTMMEHAYQISLPTLEQRSSLVRALQALESVRDVSLLMQEPTLEL